ncbi:hypothetical protein ABES80_12100 [Bacillus gobiensis]|uniref:hypothetical protein n=1 Tax=Bacillus gobiensis TaxID=1441095 RepID=UPI003D1B7E71
MCNQLSVWEIPTRVLVKALTSESRLPDDHVPPTKNEFSSEHVSLTEHENTIEKNELVTEDESASELEPVTENEPAVEHKPSLMESKWLKH